MKVRFFIISLMIGLLSCGNALAQIKIERTNRNSLEKGAKPNREINRQAKKRSVQIPKSKRNRQIPDITQLRGVIKNIMQHMVKVDGGEYTMESDSGKIVIIEDFMIGSTEVTQHQWTALMNYNPSLCKNADNPVENVDWTEVQCFISRLNSLTGLDFRLPCESEWEYAARGGKLSQRYSFSGSNNINNIGWYSGNSGNGPNTVALKMENELGLYDMTGNVWEMTSDCFKKDNSNLLQADDGFACRGGSWKDPQSVCSLTRRGRFVRYDRNGNLGFRLALSIIKTNRQKLDSNEK